MKRWRPGALREAVQLLEGCNFIEARDAVKNTRHEEIVVNLIRVMTGGSELEDRLYTVLDYYGFDEPSSDEVFKAWEFEEKEKEKAKARTAARLGEEDE